MPNSAIPAQRSVSTAQLLGRPEQVVFGPATAAVFGGRRVLVTGAGGSIGSEIVRQLRRLDPERVYMLDQDESALHSLSLELKGHGLFDSDDFVLADVRDPRAMRAVMRAVRPDIVVHAAAHKHLPLLERYPAEALRTNVIGTQNVAGAAAEAGVRLFVNVSTDKAANPVSVLGASKRLAEMIVARIGREAGTTMRTASVRFGNVLGSRGSFLPGLAWQIEHDLPVTITHPDVTRFFMTIPEAAGLVLEAALMAQKGETYVLDMGEPVSILDLTRDYARRRGLPRPHIEFTGLRPGEKLHEELVDAHEVRALTPHPRIWSVHVPEVDLAALAARLDELSALAPDLDAADLRAAMHVLLDTQGLVNLAAADAV